jgi:hypothetical protein
MALQKVKISFFLSFGHFPLQLFSDTVLTKNIPKQIFCGNLSGNLPQVMKGPVAHCQPRQACSTLSGVYKKPTIRVMAVAYFL